MSQRIISLCLSFLVSVSFLSVPALGQNKGLKDAETKKIAKLLGDLRAQPKYPASNKAVKKKKKVEKAFYDEIESLKKRYKDQDILSFVDNWVEIFSMVSAAPKAKTPAGRGRVRKDSVFQKVRGRDIGFEYAVYLPSKYKGTESWPVIVALHDKGSTGDEYLREVWCNPKRIKKPVFDQFIFIAPTIGERTVGKSKRTAKYQKRIEPFSRLHRGGIALCLRDALEKYNIDTNRMYLDGTGLGGESAAWIGVMQCKLWAGIASRSARVASTKPFSRPEFLRNLRSQCPIMICDRKNGPYSTPEGKQDRQQIDHHTKVDKLPVHFKLYEPLPGPREVRLALGHQKHDPIHDATKDIAAFFLKQKRNLYPKDLGYITYDDRSFSQTCWYVLDKADANPSDGTIASIEGKIDREKNVATFTTHNVESFRIYFNDLLFNLDNPVKIVVNDEEVALKQIDRSLDYMLKYNLDNAVDPALVMVGEMHVAVKEKPAEDKPGEGKAGEGKAGEGKAGEGKAGEGKAGEGKAGGSGAEKKGDDPKKDEASKAKGKDK